MLTVDLCTNPKNLKNLFFSITAQDLEKDRCFSFTMLSRTEMFLHDKSTLESSYILAACHQLLDSIRHFKLA